MDSTQEFPFQNVAKGEGTLDAELCLPGEYPFFNGHFPENPVLPAICIINASLELLAHQVPGLSSEIVHLKRCRFTSTIKPGERVRIEGRQEAPENWKFTWVGGSDNRTMAQLNVLLQ